MQVLVNVAAPRCGRLVGAIASSQITPWINSSIITSINVRCRSAWATRQINDPFRREAKLHQLKSRAVAKLGELDTKHHLFKKGHTVVDLGYAPGSWSQYAKDRVGPNGRVVGIDIIPAQPPKGVSTIQGDFLSPVVQKMVKNYLIEFAQPRNQDEKDAAEVEKGMGIAQPSYIDVERAQSVENHEAEKDAERLIVISDMWEPWPFSSGSPSATLNNPRYRLMNTSGMRFRDHAGSMDLCLAALQFASDTLRTGGHFVCKFYQGAEDKAFEMKLKKMFAKVNREKPEASREESREGYFVAVRRKAGVTMEDITKT